MCREQREERGNRETCGRVRHTATGGRARTQGRTQTGERTVERHPLALSVYWTGTRGAERMRETRAERSVESSRDARNVEQLRGNVALWRA